MNKKELKELKKSWKLENNSIIRIYGVCISDDGAKLLECTTESGITDSSEMSAYLKLFNKALSGKEGEKLFTLSIPNEMIEKRQQLALLRDSKLKDNDAIEEYINSVVEDMIFETSTLLLLAYGEFEIPKSDGKIFPYVLGLVCPVKPTKEALYYNAKEASISTMLSNLEVNVAEDAFMYPSFSNRESTDYEVVYAKKSAKNSGEFAELILGCTVPTPGEVQKNKFENLIKDIYGETRAEDIQTIYETIHTKINESVSEDTLYLDKNDIKQIFVESGVPVEQMRDFDDKYDKFVGERQNLQADLLINNKKFIVSDDDMKLELKSDSVGRFSIVEENGKRYIKIPVHNGMTVDGIEV